MAGVSELAVAVRPRGERTLRYSRVGMSWPAAFSNASPSKR